jgi:RES domain
MYASLTPADALVMTLLRSMSFSDGGYRALPRAAVHGRVLSALSTNAELTLISLVTARDLAAASQDEWLVSSPPHDYPMTRHWASWLRKQAPWAQGLLWSSAPRTEQPSLILFADRCGPGLLDLLGDPVPLDEESGVSLVNEILAPREVAITARPPASIPVGVYLDTDDQGKIAQVVKRVDRFVDMLGYDGPIEPVVEKGSFIRNSWAKVKGALTSEDVKNLAAKVERAAELRYLDSSQAEVDGKAASAFSSIVSSLAEIPSACILAGSILLIKYAGPQGSVVLSKNLSWRELETLERFPEILQNPQKALESLALAQAQDSNSDSY